MPDVSEAANEERLLADYLRDDDDVAALVGTRVYTHLPDAPSFPLIVLSRVAGGWVTNERFDAARIQIEAWAEKGQRAAAAGVMRAIRVAMSNPRITGGHDLGVVIGTEELNVLFLQDPVSARPRYIADYRVLLHPLQTVPPEPEP